MVQNLISRVRKLFQVQFQNAETEGKYRDMQGARGRSSSVFAFAALLMLCLAFAYLEYRALGHDVAVPGYGYLLFAILALANLLVTCFSSRQHHRNLRLIANGVLVSLMVTSAVFLQEYIAYHALEFVLLTVWMGSLKSVRLIVTLVINVVLTTIFILVMYVSEVSAFWIPLVAVLLWSAVGLGAYIGYLSERGRRMLFLETEINESLTNRHEKWAFTLVDMDMVLSGIIDFNELIALLKNHLESVISFDSYVLSSLEGKGPKPVADKVEGRLFENEDKTYWSENLISKLTQTRQAVVSSDYEIVKGFLGIKEKRFIAYRIDVPVFGDSRLLGIISLGRDSEPFDELDIVASVSITGQAMLIFRHSTRDSVMASDKTVPDSVPGSKQIGGTTNAAVSSLFEGKDMEVTDHSFFESDQTLVPKEVVDEFKRKEASVKKTITLMSRENADKVAVDRYRTAAVEGEPLTVLVIEVDELSKLREKDGDEVAYKVFSAVVKYIFSKVDRSKDILGRYGKNGLSILMPGVDMNAAEKFGEMIRKFVAESRYKTIYGEKSATLSIGVASIIDDAGDYASMVKRADMALFVAKKNGRNCVKVRL